MRTKWADCRKCQHYRPLDLLPKHLLEQAYSWAMTVRGTEPLGWCQAYQRAVTYYEGTCPRYREKPHVLLRLRRLDEFLS